MNKQYKYIFDMDGTLYQFDKGKSKSFTNSLFAADIKKNIFNFFIDNFSIPYNEAYQLYNRLQNEYAGEISIGIENEFGIQREKFFTNTWNLNPKVYITKDTNLPQLLSALKGNCALLTSAPMIWATKVLNYLDISDIFGKNIYTADLNIRKPNPNIFLLIANSFKTSVNNVISIGDQPASDIIPAASIGMKTMYIGTVKNIVSDYQAANISQAFTLLRKEGIYEKESNN